MRFDLKYLALWITLLLPSSLTLIVWRELGSGEPVWWSLTPAIYLILILFTTFVYKDLRGLRGYFSLMATLFFMGFGGGWTFGVIPWIRGTEAWTSFIDVLPSKFPDVAVHALRLTPAIIFFFYSSLKGNGRSRLYLVKGNISEFVSPSRLLGVSDKITWLNMTLRFSAIFGLGTLIFLVLSSKPISLNLTSFGVLPFVILIAGLNAFNEEFTLRAAPLSFLKDQVDQKAALSLTTVFFALGHYYGVPYGLLGVALSAFLGWFLGKSILETKGFLLAWFTHFVPDFVIFYFLLVS